jgi:hypothetical protein
MRVSKPDSGKNGRIAHLAGTNTAICERLGGPRDAQRVASKQTERKRADETERDLAQESKGVRENIITKQYF